MTQQAQTRPVPNAPQPLSGTAAWPWTALDVAWLQFLKSHQASTEPLHDLLALLVSHQMGRGHACLDLECLWQDAPHLLDWSSAQIKSLEQFASLSKEQDAAIDLFSAAVNPWAEAAKTLPWAMGVNAPLVLSL